MSYIFLQELSFSIEGKDNILVGQKFEIIVRMQNKSRENRTVTGVISIFPEYYTGLAATRTPIKKQTYNQTIPPVKGIKHKHNNIIVS